MPTGSHGEVFPGAQLVHMLPWLEYNETVTPIGYTLDGLAEWGKLTDTAIISFDPWKAWEPPPVAASALPSLQPSSRRPEEAGDEKEVRDPSETIPETIQRLKDGSGMRIIPGLKTANAAHKVADDNEGVILPAIDCREVWEEIAPWVSTVRSAAGEGTVLLENEGAFDNLWAVRRDIDRGQVLRRSCRGAEATTVGIAWRTGGRT